MLSVVTYFLHLWHHYVFSFLPVFWAFHHILFFMLQLLQLRAQCSVNTHTWFLVIAPSCSEKRGKKIVLKLITSFFSIHIYIYCSKCTLFISTSRLRACAFMAAESISFCLAPVFFLLFSIEGKRIDVLQRFHVLHLGRAFYVGLHQAHLVLVASSASLFLCTCNIASSVCCNSEVTFRLMVLL